MAWNWQDIDWPHFRWKPEEMQALEASFLEKAGIIIGSSQHMPEAEGEQLIIQTMSAEALGTSEIEGEFLDRESVQSSIKRHLGLSPQHFKKRPAEEGIAEMMVQLYRTIPDDLSHETLFGWHRMIVNGRGDLDEVGAYRIHGEPMQIVSGPSWNPRVHFEAPPSLQIPAEMERFVDWFNRTRAGGEGALPSLTRAGIAHLYFESIHPFEDGNGRVGRAIAEKALAQSLSVPVLTALASTLLKKRKSYYQELEWASQSLEITRWLLWFAETVLEAQDLLAAQIRFLIQKAALLRRLAGRMNGRQEAALLRMFEAGVEGFEGGMSSKKYQIITGASSATTTRDLSQLVDFGAFYKRGEGKGTRYFLKIDGE